MKESTPTMRMNSLHPYRVFGRSNRDLMLSVHTPVSFKHEIRQAISKTSGQALAIAKQALKFFPDDAWFLRMAGLAALVEQKPDEYLPINEYLMRKQNAIPSDHLLMAVFYAQTSNWSDASAIIKKHGFSRKNAEQIATRYWRGCNLVSWIKTWLDAIQTAENWRVDVHSPAEQNIHQAHDSTCSYLSPDPLLAEFPDLPKTEAQIAVKIDFSDLSTPTFVQISSDGPSVIPSQPELFLESDFRLNNAVYRLQSVEETWTRCVLHTFRYSAVSDEKRDGLVQIGRNLSNGAVLDEWCDALSGAGQIDGPEEIAEPGKMRIALERGPESETEEDWRRLTKNVLPVMVRRHLQPFLTGRHCRQQQDLDQLHQHYTDLRTELLSRIAADKKEGTEVTV
ncbi:MAG: hypothetical protein HQL74_14245 [Magnetococcales bacterium]|nr:hypothetical protein [Magnetococcales bacterium]